MVSYRVLDQPHQCRPTLFLVQGGSVTHLVFARVLAVATPLALLPIAVVLVTAVLQAATVGSTLLWIATIVAYTALSSGLAAWIAIRLHSTASAALAVLAVWAIVVVFIPSGVQFLAEAIHPVPSRVTYLSEARDAEGAARRNVTQRAEIYMAEHPDRADTPDDAVPGFYRSAYLANIDINARTRPLVEELESQQAAQRQLVDLGGLLSPAIIAQRLLQDASGTGVARSAEFRQQARRYLNGLLDRIGPATVGRTRLSLEEARSIPSFSYDRTNAGSGLFLLIAWLLLVATVLAVTAITVARRVGPAERQRQRA